MMKKEREGVKIEQESRRDGELGEAVRDTNTETRERAGERGGRKKRERAEKRGSLCFGFFI